jgi:hypothetical protein
MIIMSNITKNYKVGIFAMFIAAGLIGSVVAFGDNMAYATKKHNDAEQEIEQGQASEQNAQCVSGDFSLLCGNNVDLQLQTQLGNLALGQQ